MNNNSSGFTLLELMMALVVIAVLAGIAVTGYRGYSARAASTELVALYDSLREQAVANAASSGMDLCNDPPMSLVSAPGLDSPYAELSIVKVDLNYAKPLGLHIVADVHKNGVHATDITRAAYDVLNKSHHVAPKHVINDSVVSFTAMLVNTPCAASAQAPPNQQAPSQPIKSCPGDQEALSVPDGLGNVVGICVDKCPAGQTRDPKNFMQCVGSLPAQQTSQQAIQTCNITPPVPCKDQYLGNCKADFGIGSDPSINVCDNCTVATVCPQTCGVCQ
jgi:prepilin-type N-terminal cleavage/methylation domain-containing protein